MKIENALELCCFTVIASYCCNVSEEKAISGVYHELLVRKPCDHPVTLLHDINRFENGETGNDTNY